MWSNVLEMHRPGYKSIVVFFCGLWRKAQREDIEYGTEESVSQSWLHFQRTSSELC